MTIRWSFLLIHLVLVPLTLSLLLSSNLTASKIFAQLGKRNDQKMSYCLFHAEQKQEQNLDLETCGLQLLNNKDVLETIERIDPSVIKSVTIPVFDYYFSNYKTSGPDASPSSDFLYFDYLRRDLSLTIWDSPKTFFELIKIASSPDKKRKNIFRHPESWGFLSFQPLPRALHSKVTLLREKGVTIEYKYHSSYSLFSKRYKKEIQQELQEMGAR